MKQLNIIIVTPEDVKDVWAHIAPDELEVVDFNINKQLKDEVINGMAVLVYKNNTNVLIIDNRTNIDIRITNIEKK